MIAQSAVRWAEFLGDVVEEDELLGLSAAPGVVLGTRMVWLR